MVMNTTNRVLSFLLLAALPAAATAALKARAPAQVSFVALGPAGLRIEGKSSDLQGHGPARCAGGHGAARQARDRHLAP